MEAIIIDAGEARRPTIANMMKLLTCANKEVIEGFTEKLELVYAPSHVASIVRETLKYMVRLQNEGIGSALETTCKTVVDHCFAMESSSRVVLGHRQGYLRIFLHFLSTDHGLSPSLEMTANTFMFDRVVFISDLPETTRSAYEAVVEETVIGMIGRDRYWRYACDLGSMLEEHRYSPTVKHLLTQVWRSFYVFLCANDLDYSSDLAVFWAEQKNTSGLVGQGSCRRAFEMLDRYAADGHLEFGVSYCYAESRLDSIPPWCADPLRAYLLEKEREGLAGTSVKMQRVCNLRFIEYLLMRGLDCWDGLSPQIVMDFHIQDAHSTAESKNAYGSRVKQFLAFLAEQRLVAETLQLALPSSRSKATPVIKVLGEEELARIKEYSTRAKTPAELRNICIVLLGLRLGLRGVDIVRLKLTDIDWRKQVVSIIQSKTGVGIALPLPVEVANFLYRYIMEARPLSTSESVFIRHRAPYCQLSRTACAAALGKVLGIGSAGFHITRKTFASRMLSSSVPLDTIAHSLGHTTNLTVRKYLATDEASMRRCAISLATVAPGKEGVLS